MMGTLRVLLVLFAVGIQAADLELQPSQYVIDSWTQADGFPEETVSDIARLPHDYLWLTSAHSLIRFDGQRFESIYPSDLRASLWSLSINSKREIFCVMSRLGVQKMVGNKLVPVWQHNLGVLAWPDLKHDVDDRMMVLDGTEIYREENGKFFLWRKLPEPGRFFTEIDRGVWAVATLSNNLLIVRGNEKSVESHPLGARVVTVLFRKDRGLYVGTEAGLVHFEVKENGLKQISRKFPKFEFGRLAFGQHGELWAGTNYGLHRAEGDRLIPFTRNVLQREELISSLTVDDEGNVWAAYSSGGIFRVRTPRFPSWSVSEGLGGIVTRAVHHDGEGGAWVAAHEGVTHISATGKIRRVPEFSKGFLPIRLVLDGPRNLLVLGKSQLNRVDTQTLAISPVPLPPSTSQWQLMFRSRNGTLWIGNADGELYTRFGNGWQRKNIADVPKMGIFSMMAETSDGKLWLAARGAGLFRLDGDRAIPVATSQPERLLVHALYIDSSDQMWVGFDGGGLGRFIDGRFQTYAVDEQVQKNTAFFIAEDTQQHLWFGLRAGLIRASKADLTAYFDGKLKDLPQQRYQVESGLPSGNFGVARDTTHVTPASQIWLPHLRGVMRVDINHLTVRPPPPTVRIQDVVADDVSLTAESGVMTVPAETQRLQVSFHSPVLLDPWRVRYKHQLVGFQNDPVGPHSERHAIFTRVPPGDYTFRVWAANSDGIWNENSTDIQLNFRPAFYQTALFQLLTVLAGIAAVYAMAHFRFRRLRHDKEELELHVQERTAQLNRAREVAEQAAKVKSEFLATMSHEIRTPLHGILGTLELLENCSLDGEQKEYVGTARRSGASLLELLNDVLDLTRLEAGHMVLEPQQFAFRAFLRDLTDAFRHAAVVKGLDIRLNIQPQVPEYVIGDKARIRQILSNLIGNAIKFTDTGYVELRAASECIDHERHHIRITVKDTGSGIHPKKLGELFKPFSQADTSSKRRHSGTGLGLAISRRLADEMHAQLSVKSQSGLGSEFLFEVTLPSGAIEETTSELIIPHSDFALQGRILLVEDNNINQLVASRMLSQLGCAVDVASDGIEGVNQAEMRQYDLILMDSHMPRASGSEAAERIRSGKGLNANAPIIALSASSSPEERAACIAAGMNGFLPKPYTLTQLREILAPYLEVSKRS